MTYDPTVSTEPEVVDADLVVPEPAPVPAPRAASEVAVQAAAVAGASFVAGAGVVVLLKSRKARKSALRLATGGRRRRKRAGLDVVGTRSFLVDVHFVERR